MKFNQPVIEIIKERTSRRTYEGTLMDDGKRSHMEDLLNLEEIQSPFSEYAGKCRFELVSVPEFDPNEKKKLGTYGFIKGAKEFIVGAVKKSDYMKEHFGYLMEYLILAATDMGLGTCWLGGTFNRGLFGSKINVQSDEIVPAITPIGTFPEKRRMKEKIIRKIVKAAKRHPWENLFFDTTLDTPLKSDSLVHYKTLLEMVRLAPSAGNKQPWRIIKISGEDLFHFYHIQFSGSYKPFPPMDMGIAVCHWDLTAKETAIAGEWIIAEPDISSGDLKYVISWKGM